MMNKIVACIVTYNRKKKLLNCIKALMRQSYKAFDILVVDNASADGTYESIKAYIDAGVIRYENTGANLGGAGGFNYAFKKMAELYEYIWIMDDDTYPYEKCLEALVAANQILRGNYGFLSSLAEWTDGNACLMNQQKLQENIFDCFREIRAGLIPIKTASFVSLYVPSSNVKKYGLPIKDFFLWGDDEEYTRRLSKDGGFLVLQSGVLHDMATNDGVNIVTNDVNRINRYYFFIRNRVYMAKQVHSLKEIIKAYLSAMKQVIRVILYAKDNKFYRIRIIIKGMILGLTFNPKIEYLE